MNWLKKKVAFKQKANNKKKTFIIRKLVKECIFCENELQLLQLMKERHLMPITRDAEETMKKINLWKN